MLSYNEDLETHGQDLIKWAKHKHLHVIFSVHLLEPSYWTLAVEITQEQEKKPLMDCLEWISLISCSDFSRPMSIHMIPPENPSRKIVLRLLIMLQDMNRCTFLSSQSSWHKHVSLAICLTFYEVSFLENSDRTWITRLKGVLTPSTSSSLSSSSWYSFSVSIQISHILQKNIFKRLIVITRLIKHCKNLYN